ncbi:MAG: DUF3784 domain-containing protein [Bacteroidales bacterium]|nr:DUF3784 domain-containing protein [Bacteroidales bacterium]
MEFINYTNIGVGLLLIVVGLLGYRYPNMINPYGGMPPERKALVDIDGLKKSVAWILGITGGLLILTAILSMTHVIGAVASAYVMGALVCAMIVPLFVAMRKYNGWGRDESGRRAPALTPENTGKLVWVILGLSLVAVGLIIAMGSRPTKLSVGEETVTISGMYGCDIPIADIVSVKLLDAMPKVAMRTNGSDTGMSRKGHFLLKNGEECMLFIYKGAPYIEMRTVDNLYYLNGKTEEQTMKYYEQLKQLKP